MTDSSATPRNNGERPLHEDDPLMELSRILDFGVTAEDNAARSSDPEFGSAQDDLSFDAALELERELLGDFNDFSEQGQENHSAPADFSPSSPTSFDDASFASEEFSFVENELTLALEHELDLHMQEPDLHADASQFADPLVSNLPSDFDQNEFFEGEQPTNLSHPPFDSEQIPAIDSPNFNPGSSFVDDYSSELSTDWDDVQPENTHSEYLNEPNEAQPDTFQSVPALSLEDELQNLLFGDQPIAQEMPSFDEVQPDLPSELGSAEPFVAEQFFSSPPEWAEPHDVLDKNAAFTFEPELDVPVAKTVELESAPAAFQDEFDMRSPSLASDAPVYPHYPRGNFSPDSPVTGLLAPEPPRIDGHGDGDTDNSEEDFSFGEEFALDLDLALQQSSVDHSDHSDRSDQDDGMAGFDELSLNVDDFGFEASGDNFSSDGEPAEAQSLFDSDDLLSIDDLVLEGTDNPQNVEQYAHATYSDNAASPDFAFTSSFDKLAPEIETISVGETKVEQTHALDLPEIPYEEEDKNTGLSDLEAEFAEVFNTIDVEDPQLRTESSSEADRAFEDIFRENANSYLAAGAVAGAAGAAMGASAASPGLTRGATPADTQVEFANSATNDDFYNHWAASGAQARDGSELGGHPPRLEQDEEDLGSAAESYRNRPVRGRRGLIVASIAGAAVLVGGIGYHLFADGGSGEPVIIRASDDPVKVQPENPGGVTVPNQDKAVYDRVAGTLPGSPEQKSLIASGEEPIDLSTAQDTAPAVEETFEPIATPQSNTDADAPLIRPREVETMIVRPDGSIMTPQSHTTAAAEQTSPAEPDASASSDGPIISPPAETDEIAALAAGNDIPAVNEEAPTLAGDAVSTATTDTTAVQPQLPIRPPLVPSRPAQQPTNVVGNVPQRTQQAAQAPAETQVASAAGAGGYFVQIASQPSAELAQKSYANMAQRYGNVIGGRAIDIKRADIPNKGTYYRVRVQAGTKNEAIDLCERLKTAGGSCFVTQ